MTGRRTPRPLAIAGAAVAAHLVAGLLAHRYLRPAAPGAPLPERLAAVAAAGWGWRLAWLSWIPAGLTLVALVRTAAHRLPGTATTRAALAAALAALAVDAPCDLLQGWLLPRLAAGGDAAAFERLERALVLGGYTVANGLYSVAALLLTVAVARARGAALLVTGLPLVAAGLWLAVAGAAGAFAQTPAAAAATVALCLPWALQLAWVVERPRPPRNARAARPPRTSHILASPPRTD